VAQVVGQGDYDHLYLVGRRLSALLDLATMLFVFLIARALLRDSGPRRAVRGGLLAAAFYAVAVAAVQAAHFFTTDVWLVFFGTLTFYLGLLVLRPVEWPRAKVLGLVALMGLCLGLAIACKASGLFVAVPVLIALLGRSAIRASTIRLSGVALRLLRDGLIVLVAAYVGFRLASPYAFARSSWLDVTLSSAYQDALQTQRDILDGKAIFPPTIQWLLSPRLWDPFRNLVVWQMGVPLGLTAVAGSGVLAFDVGRRVVRITRRGMQKDASSPEMLAALGLRVMLLGYVVVVFLYVATRFQHMGRYLLPILPLLAVAAAYGLLVFLANHRRLLASVAVLVLALTGAYALAFHAIYAAPMTRLAASDWIVANARDGSRIANEHWDDTLPVGSQMQGYELVIVPVFEPDDDSKVTKLYEPLSTSDYYVLSSPRAWRTIGRLPDRYPLMVRFYRELFAGRLGFTRVASFSSQPRLLGVHLDDLGAEEAFWVYDHPPVKIYRHRTKLTFAEFRRALCAPPAPSACS
jgi:hypothetical protein